MDSFQKKPNSLFSHSKASLLGKLYGKWKVTKAAHQLYLEIYEKGLLELDSNLKAIEFHFDIKFYFDRKTLEITFEYGN